MLSPYLSPMEPSLDATQMETASSTAKSLQFGADHAGFTLKASLVAYAHRHGLVVDDHGTHAPDSVDYPDFAHEVARAVQSTPDALGVLVCGSGNGVCMTANRHDGVRAALAWMPEIATLARQHNDANVLCLPARFLSEAQAEEILEAFLSASFEGGRHQRRVEKMDIGPL
jgi:ribose 5-phosphate isomerase B